MNIYKLEMADPKEAVWGTYAEVVIVAYDKDEAIRYYEELADEMTPNGS
jgi:hypothetical protein